MTRHIISILVENQSGVLSRISGLFSRRGYNIDSLSVGPTENPKYSRITVAINGDNTIIDQIQKQVLKLVDVINVVELSPEDSVNRELVLIKVSADTTYRSEIIGIVGIFRANIIDVSNTSITVELTGDQNKITAFFELMEPYGIIEIARTGLTGLGRSTSMLKPKEEKE